MDARVQREAVSRIIGINEQGNLIGRWGTGRRRRGTGGIFQNMAEPHQIGNIPVFVFRVQSQSNRAIGNLIGTPIPGVREDRSIKGGADLHPAIVVVNPEGGGFQPTAFIERPPFEGQGRGGDRRAKFGAEEASCRGDEVGNNGVLGCVG